MHIVLFSSLQRSYLLCTFSLYFPLYMVISSSPTPFWFMCFLFPIHSIYSLFPPQPSTVSPKLQVNIFFPTALSSSSLQPSQSLGCGPLISCTLAMISLLSYKSLTASLTVPPIFSWTAFSSPAPNLDVPPPPPVYIRNERWLWFLTSR